MNSDFNIIIGAIFFTAMAIGIGLISRGIYLFSKPVTSPMDSMHAPSPILLIISGGLLTSGTFFMNTFSYSFFGSHALEVFSYDPYATKEIAQLLGNDWLSKQSNFIEALNKLILFAKVYGVYSFVKGLYMFSQINRIQGDGLLLKIIARLACGSALFNIGTVACTAGSLFGVANYACLF